MRIIKEFKENEYTYKLGYYLLKNKVFPRIEIYKNNELLSGGHRGMGTFAKLFYFFSYSFSDTSGTINTIKEMFNKLRKYNDIPEYVEKEFENIFILYKLNNFNELSITT